MNEVASTWELTYNVFKAIVSHQLRGLQSSLFQQQYSSRSFNKSLRC
jgi:hypothetical protein